MFVEITRFAKTVSHHNPALKVQCDLPHRHIPFVAHYKCNNSILNLLENLIY